MRINIYAHLIIIEILDDIYAREQTWSTVEYQWCTQYYIYLVSTAVPRGSALRPWLPAGRVRNGWARTASTLTQGKVTAVQVDTGTVH